MEAECADMEAEFKTQKKTFDLLPYAEENIEKLQVKNYRKVAHLNVLK